MEWKKLILVSFVAFLINFILGIILLMSANWFQSNISIFVIIFLELIFGLFIYLVGKKFLKLDIPDNNKNLVIIISAIWLITSSLFLFSYLITPYSFPLITGSPNNVTHCESIASDTIRGPNGEQIALAIAYMCPPLRQLSLQFAFYGIQNPITLFISFYIAKKYLKW